MQFDKVAHLTEAAKSSGGRVLMGGAVPDSGLFFPLTLITDVDNGNPLVDEEQFGPVLPIIRFSDVDEVIERANNNPNGLGGSIWSTNLDSAYALAERMDSGTVWINHHADLAPNIPFGGAKQSGLGVELGEEGLNEFTQLQVINIAR